MAVISPFIDRARRDLWAREMFSFIPDRDLPPANGFADAGAGPPVAFAGFPSDYSLAFLLALLQLDVRLCGIVTSPGAHAAILGDNALSRIADHLQVPLVRAWRINEEHARLQLSQLNADAMVMASFDQIVGGRALAIPRHGWLNIHPSLLPRYRGPEPVYWVIADGAATTGITLHRAVPKVDSGPILAQAEVTVRPDDNSGTLSKRLCAAGIERLPEAVEALLRDAPGTAPDMSQASYRTSVGHRSLDCAASVLEAERMVRAGVPNMLAWVPVRGLPHYVLAARVVDDATRVTGPVLGYPDGALELTRTQPTCGCHHDVADCAHREAAVASM